MYFEILGPDGPALSTFYRGLFGWDLHDGRLPGWPHYALLRAGRTGIGVEVAALAGAGLSVASSRHIPRSEV